MSNPFRKVGYYWRRLLNTREIVLDGVKIWTDPAVIPPFVRLALFRGTYEDNERRLVRGLLRPGDRVLEIGTGVGMVSLVCAKICGADNVLSYEANPQLERIIRKNYELNGLTPNLRMRAVTTDGRPISFFRNDNIVSSSIAERTGFAEKMSVESDRFHDIIEKHRPDTIVMDVEGAEIELLGNSDLPGVRNIIVEIHPHVTGEAEIVAMLETLGKHGFKLETRERKTILLSREKLSLKPEPLEGATGSPELAYSLA